MKANKPETNISEIWYNTEFPWLDTLHVLDASAHFNARCSGRQTF